MGARVSHIFWWVRRADGTPRKPDRIGARSDGPARRLVRVPDDSDLSALATLEPPDPPVRIERFSLETFGEPDLLPGWGRPIAESRVTKEDSTMRPDRDLIDTPFRADE